MQQPTTHETHDEERGFKMAGAAAASKGLADGTKTAAGPQTLAWHVHVCDAAPAGGGGGLLRSLGVQGCGDQPHTILTDVAGEARAGQCTAILGPSGCGKTTLLECITLRRRGFTGAIYVDGAPATPAYLQRMSKFGGWLLVVGYVHLPFPPFVREWNAFIDNALLSRLPTPRACPCLHPFLTSTPPVPFPNQTQTGFVPQQDIFYSHLTPREHLTFHATTRAAATAASATTHCFEDGGNEESKDEAPATKVSCCCFPNQPPGHGASFMHPHKHTSSLSKQSVEEIVEAALRQVGLGKCADTRIGGPIGAGSAAGHHAGISGGERKRLAIATELLSDPSVLILDEPTTGTCWDVSTTSESCA